MKKLITILILLFIQYCLFSQQLIHQDRCIETPNKRVKLEKPKHIGNNNYLLKVLKRHGYDLPSDYFDKIDERGFYKGEALNLKSYKRVQKDKKSTGKETSRFNLPTLNTTYYLPIHIWNHKNSQGYAAMDMSAVYETFGSAFKKLRNVIPEIEFYIKEVSYPANSPYYHLQEDAYEDMWDDYYDLYAMNIHIVKSNAGNAGGRGEVPGNNMFIVATFLSSRIMHELGHNFGLSHTHKGCSDPGDINDDNALCPKYIQEPVSRTRKVHPSLKMCEMFGDGLCDTAGSPKLSGLAYANGDGTCSFNPTNPNDPTHDKWGDAWQPDMENIMSYSICRTKLSPGQIAIALDNIQNSILFFFRSTSPQVHISGPTNISNLCSGQSYTYSVPAQPGSVYYAWEAPKGWTISGQGNRTVTISPNMNNLNDGTIHVKFYSANGNGKRVAPLTVSANFETVNLSVFGFSEIPADNYCRSFTTQNYTGANYNWVISAPTGVSFCGSTNSPTVSLRANNMASPFHLSVTATLPCGNAVTTSKYITIGNGGGPPARIELIGGDEINIFPNPMEDYVEIELTEKNQVIDMILIRNMISGEVVYKAKNIADNTKLNLENIPKGAYFIVYSMDGRLKTNKLIKQ